MTSPSNDITAVSITVQIDGKLYFVNLPHDRMMLAMHLIGGLSDSGRLNVTPAPDGFKLVSIKELV
jgi:hypothetical protein